MTAKSVHPAIALYARECRSGLIDRREFLGRATMLGLSSAAAYSMIGLSAPSPAKAAGQPGGTLRVNMETKVLKHSMTV